MIPDEWGEVSNAAWLALAESAFEDWDNPQDAIYDAILVESEILPHLLEEARKLPPSDEWEKQLKIGLDKPREV